MKKGARWTEEQLRQFQSTKEVAPAKKGKYGNIRVQIDGIWFDSTKEGEYYKTLKILQRAGAVLKFERQTWYELEVKGVLICKYKADFVVWYPDGRVEVVDVKGAATEKLPVFRMKKALMLALHGIVVKIV